MSRNCFAFLVAARLEGQCAREPSMVQVAFDWLVENAPVSEAISLVHGDYRSGNFLFDPETNSATAILDAYFTKHREMRAVARRYVCEGHYVTLLWDIDTVAQEGAVSTISGIEIFKVVDGRITDVWNPNAVAEQYPAGPWPEFTP
jgi:hypothetical protein